MKMIVGFKNHDKRPRTQDLGNKIQDWRQKIQDERARTKNLDPGPEMCHKGLGSILHIVWKFLPPIFFLSNGNIYDKLTLKY